MFEKTTIDKCMDYNFTPCIVIDSDKKIQYWNAAMSDAIGFSSSEMVNKNLSDILIDDFSHAEILKIKNKDDNICQFFYRSVEVDGLKVILLQNDTYQTKIDLEKSFNALAETTNYCAIYFLDEEGKIVSCNGASFNVNGFYQKDILDKNFSIFYLPEEIVSDIPQKHLKETQEKGKYDFTGTRIKADGTKFIAHVVMIALYNLDGTIKGFLKIVSDLTIGVLKEKLNIDIIEPKMMNVIDALDLINKKVHSRLEV